MNKLTLDKLQPKPQKKLYIKVKQKTVIYYSVTQDLSEDQLEGMMIESTPFGYTESYI